MCITVLGLMSVCFSDDAELINAPIIPRDKIKRMKIESTTPVIVAKTILKKSLISSWIVTCAIIRISAVIGLDITNNNLLDIANNSVDKPNILNKFRYNWMEHHIYIHKSQYLRNKLILFNKLWVINLWKWIIYLFESLNYHFFMKNNSFQQNNNLNWYFEEVTLKIRIFKLMLLFHLIDNLL